MRKSLMLLMVSLVLTLVVSACSWQFRQLGEYGGHCGFDCRERRGRLERRPGDHRLGLGSEL
ncbi:hypothetical protein J53TS2_05050 [Paenibacillus sp. J53TS2]|nr:hypothetical protein J53TS2_05050 [Paenibacillus sp. J53TS2]